MKPIQLIRLSELLSAIKHSITKEATLESDMAKRIMLSVIPGLADPSANQYYGGFPDYKALKSAVQGADGIIKYAAAACVEELAYYGEDYRESNLDPNVIRTLLAECEKKKDSASDLYNSGNLMESLRKAAEYFKDAKAWRAGYGGPPWAKIADTALKIGELRNTQKQVQSSRVGKSIDEQRQIDEHEVSLMKEIVVYLNVFDGLAHNNGSIFEKMLNWEDHDLSQVRKKPNFMNWQENSAYHKKENEKKAKDWERVKKMMDAKELENPIDVYRNIEDSLKGSGDAQSYKEWIMKARNHPDYQTYSQRENQIKDQFGSIKVRKLVQQILPAFRDQIVTMEGVKQRLNSQKKVDYTRDEINRIVTAAGNIDLYGGEIFRKIYSAGKHQEAHEFNQLVKSAYRIADSLTDFLFDEDYIESINAVNKLIPIMHKIEDTAASL